MQTTMHVVGKQQGWLLVASATSLDNGLLFLHDSVSKRPFLVNTGAEVSVLPATGLDTRTKQPGQPLSAANGSSICAYGTCKLTLHLASNTYQWNFIVAEVTCSLSLSLFLSFTVYICIFLSLFFLSLSPSLLFIYLVVLSGCLAVCVG